MPDPGYSHVLVDLDGCVHVSRRLLPGVAESLGAARRLGVRLGFVTNDVVHARGDYVDLLGPQGLEIHADEVITAAWAVAQLVAHRQPGARVLCVGSAAFREEHVLAGLEVVEDPRRAEAVSIGGDDSLDIEQMRAAVRGVLLGGASLYGANADRTYPAADGPAPGSGAVVASVEYATATRATFAGKPEPAMFEEAFERFGPGRYLMCGDRLDSDVVGAAAAGIDSLLVLTGVTSPSDLDLWDGPAPTHVLASLAELPTILISPSRISTV
jgi:glycerol 3-phosphatase-2